MAVMNKRTMDPGGLTHSTRYEVWGQRPGEKHWKPDSKKFRDAKKAASRLVELREESDHTRLMGWRIYMAETSTKRTEVTDGRTREQS